MTRLTRRFLKSAVLTIASGHALSCVAHAEPTDAVRLDSVRVQLLYQSSGTLSEDLTRAPGFALWNTVIGGGDANEPADDILVGAVLKSATQENNTGKLVLTVFKGEGRARKLLASHTFNGGLMEHGRLVQSMLLHDVTCDGPITVAATYGRQHTSSNVNFRCGE
jgi:hypothetical protein